jgi:hypothetical protein
MADCYSCEDEARRPQYNRSESKQHCGLGVSTKLVVHDEATV